VRILIDIGHPAHVHYFRNLARILIDKGHEVIFTTRDKEVTLKLLDHYGFRYINFGKSFRSRIGKVWGLFWFTLRLFIVALKFKPDLYLNATMYSAIVAWVLRKPHISLEDTFNMEQVRLYLPFTSVVLTGTYPHTDLGCKEIRYDGYQELAYLHPNRYSSDPGILNALGLNKSEKYVILRLVSWEASHDFGHKGISLENKRKFISELSRCASVFISSECELPAELKPFQLKISPEKMHNVLGHCSLLIGESFTMASECAVLGVPAIVIHNTRSFYLHDQEQRYGLVFNFSESEDDQKKAIKKAIELLHMPNLKEAWQQRRQKMLKDKIDPTAFFVWFVENYPCSLEIMRKDPKFQLRFK
jgi:uncharacterized protein